MARQALIEKQKKEKKYDSQEYTRCKLCGRARGYMRDFGMCRVCFRELALEGELPGVKKASW